MNKLIKITALLLIILAAFLGIFAYLVYFIPSSDKKVVTEIPKGSGLREIALRLQKEGVIRNDELFIFYVFIKDYEGRLKAGEYEFRPGYSLSQVVEKLVRGDVIVRQFTVPEGLTVGEIGTLLQEKGVMSRETFLRKAYDGEFAKELLGSSFASFEGYLFPDTYSYTKGITPEGLIRTMVSRFQEVYKSLKSQARNKPNLNDHEIITLASIVEKETGDASERPLISAVFHNRLKHGMRLDSDPTVIYGLGDSFNGNLTREHLQAENSYNTYRIVGLPPGPIANPGKESIQATMNPAQVDYLYFVSKGDGTHVFSTNYRDHQRAVTKYQKRRHVTERKRQ